MRTLTKHIDYPSRSDKFQLWHLTDWHVGAKGFNETLFRRDVARIAQHPNAYWIGGGDYVDAIAHVGDKRFKPSKIAPWLANEDDIMGAQVDYALDLIKPIANKCLGMLGGNHEESAIKYYGRDLYRSMVKGVAHLAGVDPHTLDIGYQGYLVIRWRRKTKNSTGNSWLFPIYLSHGYGGGRLPGGHALALGRVLGDYECDLALMGHRHVRVTVDKIVSTPWGDKQRFAAFVPSYLGGQKQKINPTTWSSVDYHELVGLPGTPVGSFPFTIHPDRKRIVAHLETQIQDLSASLDSAA